MRPMEEAATSKKQKVTTTEEASAYAGAARTSFAPPMTPARAPAESPTSRRTLDDCIADGSNKRHHPKSRPSRGLRHYQNHVEQKDAAMQ